MQHFLPMTMWRLLNSPRRCYEVITNQDDFLALFKRMKRWVVFGRILSAAALLASVLSITLYLFNQPLVAIVAIGASVFAFAVFQVWMGAIFVSQEKMFAFQDNFEEHYLNIDIDRRDRVLAWQIEFLELYLSPAALRDFQVECIGAETPQAQNQNVSRPRL